MIPVDEALARLFDLVRPLGTETVALTAAAGRVLAHDILALRDQPPFAASAMDGYAALAADIRPGARLRLLGEAAAGRAAPVLLAPGGAIRIFTGAPVPAGAGGVIAQEDVTAADGALILGPEVGPGRHIRPAGGDFRAGARISAPRRLRPAEVALIAAMGQGRVAVHRRPEVALIATGDELVPPGAVAGPDQIAASNAYGLYALLQELGARPRLLPIAPDRPAALAQALELAAGADLIVTIGGASVGDHDLVAPAAQAAGFDLAFHRVAMRPGKPLMAGRRDETVMLGLPGNPVSALVCGAVFLAPLARAMSGLPAAPAATETGRLAAPLPANGPRLHYLRAALDGERLTPFANQDSSLLSVLAGAGALIVQPPGDPGRDAGAEIAFIRL